MHFTWTVDAEIERMTGKFVGKEELADILQTQLEDAMDNVDLSGLGADGDSEYEMIDSNVSRDEEPAKKSKVQQRLEGEAIAAVAIAAKRFPKDYDAALRYMRELVSEQGALT